MEVVAIEKKTVEAGKAGVEPSEWQLLSLVSGDQDGQTAQRLSLFFAQAVVMA